MSKFKIGDRVTVISKTTPNYIGNKSVGDTGTITKVDFGTFYKLDNEGHCCYLGEGDLRAYSPYPNPPHKHAELIKAWADGAEIEYKGFNNVWKSASAVCVQWSNSTHYRIKPQKTAKDTELEELEAKARQLADEIKELRDET